MFFRRLKYLTPDYVLLALLLLTPNVRYLRAFHNGSHRTGNSSATPPWFSLLEEIGSSHKPTLSQHLSHLHSIRIGMGSTMLPEIRRIISLPSLRNLHIEHVFYDGPAGLWSKTPVVSARSSPVETLWMKYCDVGSQAVVQLLSCIRGLKDFYVEFGCVKCWRKIPSRTKSVRQLNYPALTTAILAHKDSLEKLDVRGIIIPESCFPTTHEGLGSLRDLRKVDRVVFSLDCFGPEDYDWYGVKDFPYRITKVLDMLPLRLCGVTFVISECDSERYEEYWAKCLRGLAKSFKPTLVALEEIVLRRESGGLIRFGKNMVDIEACLLDAGVELVTLSTRDDA